LSAVFADDKTIRPFVDGPRWREAASRFGHATDLCAISAVASTGLGRSDDLGNWDSQESANQIQR
jgi:hypothetical protein